MNNDNKNDSIIVVNPIYHEDVIHISDAIPVTDDQPFTIAIILDERESISVICVNKLKECLAFLCCIATIGVCFFITVGGIGMVLTDDS